jgi:hypothetical protein
MTAERAERRLMAVLAADVAGYSRLVGADEEGSLVQWRAHWHALIQIVPTLHPPDRVCTAAGSIPQSRPQASRTRGGHHFDHKVTPGRKAFSQGLGP